MKIKLEMLKLKYWNNENQNWKKNVLKPNRYLQNNNNENAEMLKAHNKIENEHWKYKYKLIKNSNKYYYRT